MHSGGILTRRTTTQAKQEFEKTKYQLELNQQKIVTLEQEKLEISDQTRVKTKKMQGEIITL